MDQGSSPHADAAADPVGAGRLAAALPAGWVVLGRARQGSTAPGAFPSGCHVLASPGQGIALLDIAPGATPNAVPRLRRALAMAGFGTAFPGFLPIWHGRLEPDQLHLLPTVLHEGFAAQPSMSLRDEAAAWMAALQEAMDADPGWEAAGRPKRPVNTAQPVLPTTTMDPRRGTNPCGQAAARGGAAPRGTRRGGGRAAWRPWPSAACSCWAWAPARCWGRQAPACPRRRPGLRRPWPGP
jgi:hypothetical protein